MVSIQLNQPLLLSLLLSLSILCLGTAGLAVWQWRADWRLTHNLPTLPLQIAIKNDINQWIAALPEAHLFGTAIPPGMVPVTNLQIQVTGIVAMKQGPSKVYLSVAGQPSKIYKLGDTLPSGIKISSISADTVIFENEGHYEKLSLARSPLHFSPRGPHSG